MKRLLMIIVSILMTSALFADDTDIRLNSLGFLPNFDKIATINGTSTDFTIIRASDGSVRYTGTVTGPVSDASTGETQLYKADFSNFYETGTFYMSVSNGAASLGKSVNFPIAQDVYNAPFVPVFKAMYEWRCGTAVSVTYGGNTFSHAACHLNDAYDNYVGGTGAKKASLKGWHDAGDYNKYVNNAGVTMGMLFKAWEMFGTKISSLSYGLPSTAPGYPEFLEELKWETDWLLTMQRADGSVYEKVSSIDFDGFELPELDLSTRYFWGYNPVGTAETGVFCALMAEAYRNFKPYNTAYAAACLGAATSAYNYLQAHLSNTQANINGCNTGDYTGSDPDAARLWAAVEMWEATGTAAYLIDAETRINSYSYSFVDTDFDWNNVKNLGMYTYVLSARAGRNASLLANVKSSVLSAANSIVSTRNSEAYGRAFGANYWWGCNGSVARQAMTLQIANIISEDAAYLNTTVDILGYLFGRNMHDRSYVTGVGIDPPMNPHHRPSGGDSIAAPWPGYLVGGSPGTNNPGATGNDPVVDAMPSGLPPAQYWQDQMWAWSANEVCLNWQGALIFAMAGCINGMTRATFTATPSITGTPPTSTNTPTITETHTITETWTITETSTITQTSTITPTATITPTEIYDVLEINNHYTYPNPSANAPITFRISHKGFIEKLKIKIFTYSSRKIGEAEAENLNTSVTSDVIWNPPYKQLGNGLYYYVIEAQGKNTPLVRKRGVFVVLNDKLQ